MLPGKDIQATRPMPTLDPVAKISEYKVCAVRAEKRRPEPVEGIARGRVAHTPLAFTKSHQRPWRLVQGLVFWR
jgi:hypothetical protein